MFIFSLSSPCPLYAPVPPPADLQNACRSVSKHPQLGYLSNGSFPYLPPYMAFEFKLCKTPMYGNNAEQTGHISHRQSHGEQGPIQLVSPVSLCREHTRTSSVPLCVFQMWTCLLHFPKQEAALKEDKHDTWLKTKASEIALYRGHPWHPP